LEKHQLANRLDRHRPDANTAYTILALGLLHQLVELVKQLIDSRRNGGLLQVHRLGKFTNRPITTTILDELNDLAALIERCADLAVRDV